MPESYRPQLVLPLLGALLGYLLLHPYTMAVYTLAHLHRSGNLLGGWQWNDVLGLGLTPIFAKGESHNLCSQLFHLDRQY